MSYIKTNWNTGDIITAEKLNNMENGIESASELYIVNFDANSDNYTISSDKEYADILDAYNNGKIIVAKIHLYNVYNEESVNYADIIHVMTPQIEPYTGEIDYFFALSSQTEVSVSFDDQDDVEFTETTLTSYYLVFNPYDLILTISGAILTDEEGSLKYDGEHQHTYRPNPT